MASNNIFALLDNDDGAVSTGASRASKKGASASKGEVKKEKAPISGFPGEQPKGATKHQSRVPDRAKDTHATEGGMRGGRVGRGRARGGATDGSVRQFDRHGAPTKHAPNHAQKGGAGLGPQEGVDLHAAAGHSVEEVVEGAAAQAAAASADAEADAAFPDMVIEDVDPDDDGLKTFAQHLASKKIVDAPVQIREVQIDESQFNKVKPLKREDDEEEQSEEQKEEARKQKKRNQSKNVINLDEFRGGREADAKYRAPESSRGGRGGYTPRGGARGGARGGSGAPRGGRGGAFVPRGGRGGFNPRGGRGFSGFAPPVAVNDKTAFPPLG